VLRAVELVFQRHRMKRRQDRRVLLDRHTHIYIYERGVEKIDIIEIFKIL